MDIQLVFHRHRSRVEIDRHLNRLELFLGSHTTLLACIHQLTGVAMADKDAVMNEINALRDLINQDNATDQAAIDQLNGTIQSLRDQITTLQQNPDNSAVQTSDFDDILNSLEGLKTLIRPVDASGAANRTTTTATGESPIAGTTVAGTPINPPNATQPSSEQTGAAPDGSTGSGTTPSAADTPTGT